ncbi:MAG: DUF2442 domain-containing protein [Blastocatellales bacterium]|nr:DUF2442 domain-containing protein [Blastocatellales bacterium]
MAGIKAGKWTYSEEELQRQIEAARLRGAAARREPRATGAHYDADKDRVTIEFDNGITLCIPSALIEGLGDASPPERSDIAIAPLGNALRWEGLDLDLGLTELAAGIFGTRAWMSQLGRLGGKSTSADKAAAARANGRRGGRPRKYVPTEVSAHSISVLELRQPLRQPPELAAVLARGEGKPLSPQIIERFRSAIDGDGIPVVKQTVQVVLSAGKPRLRPGKAQMATGLHSPDQLGQEDIDAALAVAA